MASADSVLSVTFVVFFLIPSLLLLVGSAIAYIAAIVVRDIVTHGRRAWSFSLRSMLVVTTMVAILLGMLGYALR
jgi:hypothetical protein